MKARRISAWTVAVVLLCGLLAAIALQRPQFHPYVVFQAGEALQIAFLNHARGSEGECRAVTGRIFRAVAAQCPACRQVENRCLDSLDTRQRKILSGQPLDIPVMRTAEGAVAFLSTAPDIAHSVCREAERHAGGKSAECAAAGPHGIALSLAKVGSNSGIDALPAPASLAWLTLLAFAVSVTGCFLIIRSEKLHGRFSHDLTTTGPQKFHAVATPRVGGAAMVAALVACVLAIESYGWVNPIASYGLAMLALSALPAFAGGFGEDVTGKVGVLARLMLTFAAGVFAAVLVGATLDRLDMPLLDPLLQQWPLFAIVFTAFAVGGIANAINITDGYNGLAGGYSIMVLAALGWVAYQAGDPVVLAGSLAMLGAVLGFLVWNYPAGRIFMGDGGAYLLGFWLAELGVLLVVRNPDVSPWFPLILLAYPIVDTLFSIYRRKLVRGHSAGRADAMHLHQLIYRRLARVHLFSSEPLHKRGRNNLVALYICAGAALFMIPALLVWHSTTWLVALGIAFWAAYLWLYFRLVRLRAPSWLVLSPRPKLTADAHR